MSYTKKNRIEIFEATQTTVELKNVNIYRHGDVTVPAGFWLVTLDGNLVECPSDEGFKENYTLISEKPFLQPKETVITKNQNDKFNEVRDKISEP